MSLDKKLTDDRKNVLSLIAEDIPDAMPLLGIDQTCSRTESNYRKTIAVLFGGCSPEYNVSLKSAYAVIQEIDPVQYDIVLIGISERGDWFEFEGDMQMILDGTWCNDQRCVPVYVSLNSTEQGILVVRNGKLEKRHIDIVLPILHGKNGEDGTVQGLFQLAGIPVIGCGVLASAICMDKDRAHKLVSTVGVAVPKSFTISKSMCIENFADTAMEIGYPLFVKPVRSGSSYGITKISNPEELVSACEKAFEYDDNIVVEECVVGFEVGCAVMGKNKLYVGEIDEIELSNGFFDFNEKYSLKTSAIHVPARIENNLAERIKETAKLIYRCLDCKGFARVDMFITENKEIVFNEVNTIPGFTGHSRYPNMMKASGITFKQLIRTLLSMEEQ